MGSNYTTMRLALGIIKKAEKQKKRGAKSTVKNRVSISICEKDYVLMADEPPEYMHQVAALVDERIRQIQQSDSRSSAYMAAVLAAVNLCDEWQKAQRAADHLRGQIKQYLDDASRSRQEADEARREVMRLKNEIQDLKIQSVKKDVELKRMNKGQ